MQSRQHHADHLELLHVHRVYRLHEPRHHVAEGRRQLVVVVEKRRRRLAGKEGLRFHSAVLERTVRVGGSDDGVGAFTSCEIVAFAGPGPFFVELERGG